MPLLSIILGWLKGRQDERRQKADAGELCPYRVRGCDGTQCDDCLTDWQI